MGYLRQGEREYLSFALAIALDSANAASVFRHGCLWQDRIRKAIMTTIDENGGLCTNELFVGIQTIRNDTGCWRTIIRRWRDDGRRMTTLRYLADAEPDKIRQQLPLEQVPMKGAPYR